MSLRRRGAGPAGGPSIDCRLTPIGRGGAWATLAVGAAAFNTANNLIYLLFGLMLVMYPLSWLLARAALRRVEADVLLPRAVRGGAAAAAAVRVRHVRGGAGSPAISLLLRLGGGEARVAWPYVGRGETLSGELDLPAMPRGVFPTRAVIECPFPFGLMVARRPVPGGEVVVLPAALPGWREPRGCEGRRGERSGWTKGRGVDLLNIREYRPGEDARFMDWKATARLDRPMLREHARESDFRAAVLVDPTLPRDGDEGRDEVERAISRAAGALEGLASRGWILRLVTPEGVVGGALAEQLEHLARLSLLPAERKGRVLQRRLDPGEPWLLYRAGGPATGEAA